MIHENSEMSGYEAHSWRFHHYRQSKIVIQATKFRSIEFGMPGSAGLTASAAFTIVLAVI